MKKAVYFLLAMLLTLFTATFACADEKPTILQNEALRTMEIKGLDQTGNYPANPVIAGQSPVTGMPWDGRYQPMLVQIDNTRGGVEDLAQWGVSQADIVYETPSHKGGYTGITFLFSDVIPNSVGPIRSARIIQAELREEWDAGFIFYGVQESKGTDVNELFENTGAKQKGVLFSGIVGMSKPWKQYFSRIAALPTPHNADANVQAMQALIPIDFIAPLRPYLFTDVLPAAGAHATAIDIEQENPDYASSFVYDAGKNGYLRSVHGEPYIDRNTREQPSFSNVIIQRTTLTFYENDRFKPLTVNIGSGNADIFIGGKYIPGFWVRTGMNQRTIFFDQDGNEIRLQRGKTFISILDNGVAVSFTGD